MTMQDTQEKAQRISLSLILTSEDAELLRTAMADGPVLSDALGNKHVGSLAQVALSAVCNAILRGGYRPRPLAAELQSQDGAALPSNTLHIQLT
jgi:hypothetical protein